MQQLLEAALLPKPKALTSWRKYLSRNDLQAIDHSAISLLPLVYNNLKEDSHFLCKSAYRHTWVSNQTLWANILPTLEKLLAEGIEKIAIMKGMGMILGIYKNFGVRSLGDIDILIDRAHIPLAHSKLISWGWTCKLPRFNPYNPHQLSRWNGANYTHPSGLNLDLHWALLLESTASVDQAALQEIPSGIHPLSPIFLFLQTCIHGFKKSSAPLIRWVPDAVTILKCSKIDFPKLFELAKSSHLTLPLSSALKYLSNTFPDQIPPFSLKPSLIETLELKANLQGRIYLAGYFRARLKGYSLLHYLQHTANLSSPWHIPLYAPYWILKRIYRFCLNVFFKA